MKKALIVALSLFYSFTSLSAEIIIIGKGMEVRAFNDSRKVVVYRLLIGNNSPAVFNSDTLLLTPLAVAPGTSSTQVFGMNNNGDVVGSSDYTTPTQYKRATLWPGGGNPVDLGAINSPNTTGSSTGWDINDSGFIVGDSTYCRPPATTNCTGVIPAGGNPLGLLFPNPDSRFNGYSARRINNAGAAIGDWPIEITPGNFKDGTLFQGGTVTPVGFKPAAILSDGTIIGSEYGASSIIKRRDPSGAITTTNPNPCPLGGFPVDANDIGDILIMSIGSNGMQIIHDGECYKLSDLLAPGETGYQFPSTGGFVNSMLNNDGKIATMVSDSTYDGTFKSLLGVVFTPTYPFAIKVIATPTGVPGEYDFEATTVRGTPGSTTTWDFGDGSAPQTTGAKVRKKFTKPGKFTVKATTPDATNPNRKASSTFVIDVPAPTLNVSIVIPNFEEGEVPLGTDFRIDITVFTSADGVGDISEIAFQEGTFTASNADVLSYTTANTSPFSLSPGAGNTYPLNVKAAALGTVELQSVVIGKDATGKSVSANHERTVEVFDGVNPTALKFTTKALGGDDKLEVKIKNNSDSTVAGRFQFFKPAKKTAAAKKKKGAGGAEKILSGWKQFSVDGGKQKSYKLKPKAVALQQLKSGQSIKAKIRAEIVTTQDGPTQTLEYAATLRGPK